MKKIAAAIFLSLIMIVSSSCTSSAADSGKDERPNTASSGNRSSQSVITQEAPSLTTFSETTVSELTEGTFVITEQSKSEDDYLIYPLLNALVSKDEDVLIQKCKYAEGKTGYLYSVDFESYKIIDKKIVTIYDGDSGGVCPEYTVELNIKNSSDARFPVGTSRWKIGFGGFYCAYIMPANETKVMNRGLSKYKPKSERNSVVNLSYAFSRCLGGYDTIKDVSDMDSYIRKDDRHYADQFRNFLFVQYFKYYDGGYSVDLTVNEENTGSFLQASLGIQNFDYKKIADSTDGINITDFGKYWETDDFYTVDSYTFDYLELTYYADCSFLTPARTMRYYYTLIDGEPRLLSTELIKNYGYDILCVDYLDLM